MILSYDLMARRFSAKLQEDDLRKSIKKLEKEGFNIFSFTGRHGLSSLPVYLLMKNRHTEFLIKYLDEINHDWTLTIPKSNDMSLLSLAAHTENLDFLNEWKNRGLDWHIESWPSHPLAEALFLDKPHTVNYLMENGCNWTMPVKLKYRMPKENTGAFEVISQYKWMKLTTPAYALAISAGRAEFAKKAILAVGQSNIDLEVKVPDPSFYTRGQKVKIQLNIPLGNFIEAVTEKTYMYAFPSGWWASLKPLFINNFKSSRFGESFNWKCFEDPLTCSPALYKGLASSFEKPVNDATQKRLLIAFMESIKNPYKAPPVKSYANKKRLDDLWSSNGILSVIPEQTFVQIGVTPMNQSLKFSSAGFMPDGVTSVPVFPATVFRFIKQPDLWRSGLDNPNLVKQFWELVSYLPTKSAANQSRASWHSQSWTTIFAPLHKLVPDILGVKPWSFEKPQKDKEKVWKSFDLIAAKSNKKDITSALEKFLTTKNFNPLGNSEPAEKRSPICVLSFSVVFDWAIDRGHLDPNFLLSNVSEILKESDALVKQFEALPAFNKFVSGVENRLLKDKVKNLSTSSVQLSAL